MAKRRSLRLQREIVQDSREFLLATVVDARRPAKEREREVVPRRPEKSRLERDGKAAPATLLSERDGKMNGTAGATVAAPP
ncbi:hypothetical protein C2S51_003392 [Perilla frutescens var. frutescens]|nr:hypothetical protein C2S51_003392 [Perilla frutescens var. frutescens]